LTRDLLVSLNPGMLLLADRNFLGWQLWREAAATGAERCGGPAPASTCRSARYWPTAPTVRVAAGRRRDGDPIPVRVIEYSIISDDGTAELCCLLTTLLDPATAPAAELAGLYAPRWN